MIYPAVKGISPRCHTEIYRYGYFFHWRPGIPYHLDYLVFLSSFTSFFWLSPYNCVVSLAFKFSFYAFYYIPSLVYINYSAAEIIGHRNISLSGTPQCFPHLRNQYFQGIFYYFTTVFWITSGTTGGQYSSRDHVTCLACSASDYPVLFIF